MDWNLVRLVEILESCLDRKIVAIPLDIEIAIKFYLESQNL